MELIIAEGVVKQAKELLEHVSPSLETDGICELTLTLKLSRRDFLRLGRNKLMKHAVMVQIGLPQEQLEFPDEVVKVVESEFIEVDPNSREIGLVLASNLMQV